MLRNIKAAPGRVIRIPGKPGAMLSHEKWLSVEFDSYWARRERCGDIVAEPLPVRHPRPAPAPVAAPAVKAESNEPKKAPAKKAPVKKAKK